MGEDITALIAPMKQDEALAIRLSIGMQQKDFSALVGLSAKTLLGMEKGQIGIRRINAIAIRSIATALKAGSQEPRP